MSRPALAGVALALLLAACGSAPATSTITVPPPPPEPSPLASQPNVNHIHAILPLDGKRWLVATHNGAQIRTRGVSTGTPVAGLSGDVLQLARLGSRGVLAAGHNIGIQLSADGTTGYAPISPDVAGLDVHGLAVDPRDPSHLWAYAVKKGILSSTDGGAHWTHRPGQADTSYLTGLVVTADGTLLAGSPDIGILATPDNGATFTTVRGGTGQVYALAASATSADVVVAATAAGILLTQSGGKDWAVGQTTVPVTGIAIDPAGRQRFYAGGADGSLFTSGDSGATWDVF